MLLPKSHAKLLAIVVILVMKIPSLNGSTRRRRMEKWCSRRASILLKRQKRINYVMIELLPMVVIRAQLSTAQPPVVWDLAKHDTMEIIHL